MKMIRVLKSLSLKTTLFLLLVGVTLALAGCASADSDSGNPPAHSDHPHSH